MRGCLLQRANSHLYPDRLRVQLVMVVMMVVVMMVNDHHNLRLRRIG